MTDVAKATATPSSHGVPPLSGGPPPAYGAGPEHLDSRRWIALLSVLTASFMVLLDISIVNVAIPSIRNNLGASDADIQFVVAGYGLAYALMLITGGRLGDIFGRKKMLMIGMGGFVAASALCGLALTAVMLDISRVIQGLVAALMFPQVLSIIQVTFPPRERGKAFGILGAVIGIATITGPLVGGLIIRDDVTGGAWRWIFLVNLPVGIAALIAAARVVTESRAPNAKRLDITGVLLASTGLFLLVFPLVEGQTDGWPLWTFVCMAASPFVLAAFVLYERSLGRDRFPLVQLSLFRIRAFAVGVVIAAFFLAGIPAFFFTISLMMQLGLGWSALHAGLTIIPYSLGTAISSAMSTRIAPRLGKYTITLGSALLCAGTLGVILTLRITGASVTSYDLIPAFVVGGLGLGTVIAPLLNVILAGVPGRDAGSASGVLTTFQQLGGAIGLAVIGVVFFGLLGGRAETVTATVAPALQTQLVVDYHFPAAAAKSAVAGFDQCFDETASETDPTVVPPSCRSADAQVTAPVKGLFAREGQDALARDFVTTNERTLLVNIGLWLVTGLLALLLPRARSRPPAGGTVAH